MPINPGKARLWFASAEEQQHYDDLMMANIEPSQDKDLEQPNFTFINTKPKAERFFEYTDKARRQLDALGPDPSRGGTPSLAHFRELPLLMTGLATFAGYFVLRELPVRNFYARGFLMTLYAFWLYDRHRFLGAQRGIVSHVKLNYDSETFKTHEQFTNVKPLLGGTRLGATGLPPVEERWRMLQPGFYSPGSEDLPKTVFNLRRARPVDWDGTFNQPVVPLLSPQHRDMKGTLF